MREDVANAAAPTMAELRRHRDAIERIAAVHGAANVRVCGSVAQGDARPGSDVDLVVDMAGERDVLDLSELVLDLQRELGRPVEVLKAPPAHAPSAHSPVNHIVAAAIPLDARPAPGGRPSGERDRRLLGELADSLALIGRYTAGDQEAFLRNEMAVDATRQRLREIALACARLSAELKARHPGVRWRALTGLPGILGHGPYPAWEISRNHLTQLRAVIDTETPPAGGR
jgi:predicted nucleotidyltransferase/uncharacterized protein with HEPN domain